MTCPKTNSLQVVQQEFSPRWFDAGVSEENTDLGNQDIWLFWICENHLSPRKLEVEDS
jgi:hypothetical protein